MRPNLSKVVKVVLVSDPSVAGQQTVGLVGDVAHVLPLTNEKLSLEELRGNMRTRSFIWIYSRSGAKPILSVCFPPFQRACAKTNSAGNQPCVLRSPRELIRLKGHSQHRGPHVRRVRTHKNPSPARFHLHRGNVPIQKQGCSSAPQVASTIFQFVNNIEAFSKRNSAAQCNNAESRWHNMKLHRTSPASSDSNANRGEKNEKDFSTHYALAQL